MQGHHAAKPHTSYQVPRCHMHACCSRSCELVDAQALSTHRSRVLVRRQFSLPAYMQVTNFCHIFGCGNGGRLIRRTAYTRVYTVGITECTLTKAPFLCSLVVSSVMLLANAVIISSLHVFKPVSFFILNCMGHWSIFFSCYSLCLASMY